MRGYGLVKTFIVAMISLVSLCAVGSGIAFAQESLPAPFLIKDINANTLGSNPGIDYTDVNGTVFFTADDHVHGRELWRTDAVSGGAVLVKDIYPGVNGSFPHYLTAFDGRLYFMADDGIHGSELWASDGTEAGTMLLKDINPGTMLLKDIYPGNGSSLTFIFDLRGFFSAGDYIYLWANDGVHGRELWRTDGTTDGTILVKDINPGPDSSFGTRLGPTSFGFFFTANDGTHGEELWVTNGEPSGTTLVADIRVGAEGSDSQDMFPYGDALFFTADDGVHGRELWAVNGEPVSAFLVADIWAGAEGSDPSGMFGDGERLVFKADDGTHGVELWRTDGTTAGTAMIKDINPGSGTPFSWMTPPSFTQYAGDMYFVADDGTHGFELWKTNGTTPDTVLVADIFPGSDSSRPRGLAVYRSQLMFTAASSTANGLWHVDSSTHQATLVKEMPGGIFSKLYVINDVIVFIAPTEAEGIEIWQSDGTEAGTGTITNFSIWDGFGAAFGFFHVANRLFFDFNDYLHGKEPWFTDGTAAGTALLEDINDSETDDAWPREFVSLDKAMLFSAEGGDDDRWLWRSDGTPGDVILMSEIAEDPEALIGYGGQVFFFAKDPEHGQELWKTDGTPEGTALVLDIAPGAASSDYGGHRWTARTDSLFFFNANDGVHGDELWRSDGTAQGAYMVKDINPNGSALDNGAADSKLGVDDLFFFRADDGVHGLELWRSDGMPDGTFMVKDIYPGSGDSRPGYFVEFQDMLYFSASDPEHGVEFWRSDGTPDGTFMVKDIAPGARSSFDFGWPVFTVAGDLLFFGANDRVHGRELWKSDGTPEGTVMVKEIAPGSDSAMVTGWHSSVHFAELDDVLYFPATTGNHDLGLWRSDGTTDGTSLAMDIPREEGEYKSLTRLMHMGRWLYFWVEGGMGPAELWRSDGSGQNAVRLGTFEESPPYWQIDAMYPIAHTDVAVFDADDGQLGGELWGIQIINQAPAPVPDDFTVDEDATLTVHAPGVLANDSDGDRDELAASVAVAPTHGTVTLSADGGFVYMPTANFNGMDTWAYACADGHGHAPSAQVIITVTPVKDPPVAVDNSVVVDQGMTATIDVLANDFDVDGDPLSIQAVTQPGHGVTAIVNNQVAFTADADYVGADAFSYVVSDGTGYDATGTVDVTITVTPVRNPPVAVDDSVVVDQGMTATIDVLANDFDVDGDPLSIQAVTQPGHGVTAIVNNQVTFTADADYVGADAFSYVVSDGTGYDATGTVNVTIQQEVRPSPSIYLPIVAR